MVLSFASEILRKVARSPNIGRTAQSKDDFDHFDPMPGRSAKEHLEDGLIL